MAAMRRRVMGWCSGGVAEALSVMCRGNHDGVGWAPLYLEVGRLRSPGQLLANMPAYGLFAWFVPRAHRQHAAHWLSARSANLPLAR